MGTEVRLVALDHQQILESKHTAESCKCENIRNGYLYVMTQHLVILKGIYGFKFPKRFSEISSRDLTSSLLFYQS
jgi:hypothetical protein